MGQHQMDSKYFRETVELLIWANINVNQINLISQINGILLIKKQRR